MSQYKLQMKYKGERNYVHGSDFFTQATTTLLIDYSGWLERIVFRRFTKNHCLLVLQKPLNSTATVATILWRRGNGEQLPAWIVEGKEKVQERYPYDESAVTTGSLIDGESISYIGSNEYSVIENVIALTKKLNYALSPEINGKWIFGQLTLTYELPTTCVKIVVTRTSEIKNKFSRNNIVIDGVSLGEIRFIVGKP